MRNFWRSGMDVGTPLPNFSMYSNRKQVKKPGVSFFCTQAEKVYIRTCAKKTGKSLSAYVRDGALQGFAHKDRSLPSEVLAFQGQLAELCGLLEVIQRKRLDADELNALERAQLKEVCRSLQEFLEQIKQHLS
jgi:hypothetical protein